MWILILAIAFIILAYIFTREVKAQKFWNHYFTGMQISGREFFNKVKMEVERRGLPDVKLRTFNQLEEGIFSSSREYLRIVRGEDVVDIGCALFGKEDCFVSWISAKKELGILSSIPVLNTISGTNPNKQSYYQINMAAMFREAIHSIILSVIDEYTEAKGYRKLTEQERLPIGGR